MAGAVTAGVATVSHASADPTFQPLPAPARIVDTRSDGETTDGTNQGTGIVRAGRVYTVQIAGRAGVDNTASAVTLNVTAVAGSDPGFLTVYPCDQERPNASHVNFYGGTVAANSVFTGLDGDGRACVYTLSDTHLIVDVNGWMPGGVFDPLAAPQRIADTRPDGDTADGNVEGVGKVAARGVLEVPVAGRVGIGDDATAVVLNITAVDAEGPGFFTVYPCDARRPTASNVNYQAGVVSSNSAVAKLDGDGHVCVYTLAAAHVVVDVGGDLADDVFVGLTAPRRLVDSRADGQTTDDDVVGFGYRRAGTTLEFPVSGRAGIPEEATAVALNVTAVGASDPGFLTLHPRNSRRPNASNVNYYAGGVGANTVIAAVGGEGRICLYTSANTDVIVDVAGYFVGEPPADTGTRCPTELAPNSDYAGDTSAHAVGPYGLVPGRYVGQVKGDALCDVYRSDEPNWVLGTLYGSLSKWGPGQFIVDVKASDRYVHYRFSRCPVLVPYEAPSSYRSTISPGWYTVGAEGAADLAPGRYRATFSNQWNVGSLEAYRCVGRTVTAFDGNRNPSSTIEQVEVFEAQASYVEITLRSGDGFFTEGCTPWERIG